MSINLKFDKRFTEVFSEVLLQRIYDYCFVMGEPVEFAFCVVFNPKTNKNDWYDLRCDYNREGRLEIFNTMYYGTSEYLVTPEEFYKRFMNTLVDKD